MCNKLERLIHVVGQYNHILKYSIFVLNIDEFKKKISHIENHIENIVIERSILVLRKARKSQRTKLTDAISYMIFINQNYEEK